MSIHEYKDEYNVGDSLTLEHAGGSTLVARVINAFEADPLQVSVKGLGSRSLRAYLTNGWIVRSVRPHVTIEHRTGDVYVLSGTPGDTLAWAAHDGTYDLITARGHAERGVSDPVGWAAENGYEVSAATRLGNTHTPQFATERSGNADHHTS